MSAGRYVSVDVVDTARLCGLEIKESTLESEEVRARCPYCRDYKYRMYLSHRRDNAVFWCHNCGTGGNAVTLYKDFNPSGRSLTTAQAFRELLENPLVRCDQVPYEVGEAANCAIRPLRERSEIYLTLLTLLDLEEKHRRNLMNRGLSEQIIAGNLYRSIPTDPTEERRVTGALSARFDLAGVPGFHRKNGAWHLASTKRSGILIPVCSKDDLIQGLQIRLDDPPPKIVELPDGTKQEKKGERFRWLSSGGSYYRDGTGISSYIHVVGDPNADTVYLTEGPLKADVASFLSGGRLFIGLTGVQNVRYLAKVIGELKPRRIVECVDMDARTNPHVQRAQAKIRSIAVPLCEEYRTFVWPSDQKGIDDWLLFEKLKRERGLSVQREERKIV